MPATVIDQLKMIQVQVGYAMFSARSLMDFDYLMDLVYGQLHLLIEFVTVHQPSQGIVLGLKGQLVG